MPQDRKSLRISSKTTIATGRAISVFLLAFSKVPGLNNDRTGFEDHGLRGSGSSTMWGSFAGCNPLNRSMIGFDSWCPVVNVWGRVEVEVLGLVYKCNASFVTNTGLEYDLGASFW